tara:strand:- start:399 stop:596 length:198 start_codon:yes stop_codon:yes gene_type:complete
MKDNIIECIRTIRVHGRNRILAWIETTSSKINGWAWDKRWKERNPDEWIKGFRKWKSKKERCPHN